jgi:hypothetical protein
MSGPLEAVTDALMQYLGAHENDIALDINDYGDLAPVFFAMFGHKARGNPKARPVAYAVSKALN